jgi:hypothetical protein
MTDFRQSITAPVVCEKTTAQLVQTLTDETGATITAGLSTLTLTLYERRTRTILNSRTASNVLNANGGTLTAGVLTLVLSALDNALVSQDSTREDHVALLEYTWASGAKSGKKEITFTVANQVKVT